MIVTSVCSRREWTHSTVLYGSTTAVATCGHDQTVKLSLDFLPVCVLLPADRVPLGVDKNAVRMYHFIT